MSNVTVNDLQRQIEDLGRLLGEKVRQGERLEAVVMALLECRVGDARRLTVLEVAALEEKLHGKRRGYGSVAGVKRRIANGTYHMEKRDGEKQGRILVDEVLATVGDYRPIAEWRLIHEARKRQR